MLLKDIYSPEFYETLVRNLGQVLPRFDRHAFLERIFIPEFSELELKERMAHTSEVLSEFLPKNFPESAPILYKLLENFEKNGIREQTIEFMFLPEYIAKFGLKNYETAIPLIEKTTQFTSCEFAVRPFLIHYEEKMLAQMLAWSKHLHRKVRRLASEGARPRLPWGMAIPNFKKNPQNLLPILENLKNDSCEVVRRSVANHLNDISKDHPEIVIGLVKKWKGQIPETDALLKHASRTLLKAGNPEILAIYDLQNANFGIENLEILTPEVQIGDKFEFRFQVKNTSTDEQVLRLEYAIYFLLNNGNLTKKVFKISEKTLLAKQTATIIRKHNFRVITTRKYYVGKHAVSVITNGKESEILPFELKN